MKKSGFGADFRHFDLVHCPSDAAAERLAAAGLRDSLAADRVEVWRGTRLIARSGLERGADGDAKPVVRS